MSGKGRIPIQFYADINNFKKPNNKNRLSDPELVGHMKKAVKMAIEKQEAMGVAVVHYDSRKECLYTVNPDGTRKIVKSGVKKVKIQ